MKNNSVLKGILTFIACIIIFVGFMNIIGNIGIFKDEDLYITGWIQMFIGIFTLVFGVICEKICYEKGRQENGFYYGYFLGIIGLLIALSLKDESNKVVPKNVSNSNTENKYGQLAKLNELKENGVLTEEEFEIEKRKILE